MAMRRTLRRLPSRRGSRPNYQWARIVTAADTLASATGTPFDLLSEFKTDAGVNMGLFGATVTRIRLSLTAISTTAPSAGTDFHSLLIGIIKTSGLTGTEVPRPQDDQHADWMWWEMYSFEGAVGSTLLVQGVDAIDVKARRRINELEDQLWLVVDQANPTGAIEYRFASSVLLNLGRK